MKDKIRAALEKRYPGLKPYQAKRCADNYILAVTGELALQLALGNATSKEIAFSSDDVRARCGRVAIEGRNRYVLTVMQDHPSTSLVLVTYKGNSITREVSKVTFNPRYKRGILEELQSDNMLHELNPSYLDELEKKANVAIDVDPESLQRYIDATKAALSIRSCRRQYDETLTGNLLAATALLNRIRCEGKRSVLREYWEEIDCGRMYGHGLSLQRVPRFVRNAALGNCHKYDFKASSYALMTSLAIRIDPTLKIHALKTYIQRRSSIRKRIARKVGISEEWMKEIFTAIGFGARTNDNPRSYARNKLGEAKYYALMANEEFADIQIEFEAVAKTINRNFPSDGFDFMGRTYNTKDPKTGTKRSRAQKLAWIYQRMESEALRTFVDCVKQNPLLVAHDCVYYKVKLEDVECEDICYKLRQRFSLICFEHEPIVPIGTPVASQENVTKPVEDIERTEYEALIKGYCSNVLHQSPISLVMHGHAGAGRHS